MHRRSFLRSIFMGGVAGTALTLPRGLYAANKKLRWRLALGVPRTLPIWGPGIERFSQNIEKLTDGGLKIKVYGAGELVPALETFEAVRSGKIQLGHSAAYYWQGKIPASPFFTATPFGTSAIETLSWLQSGGGQKLYNEIMSSFGVVAFPCGATPAQMMGWFNKEIRSIDDLKGLKIRVPGIASQVYRAAGASPVLIPGGEVFTSLSTGVIDAVEWVGPYHDYTLGLHKAAKYYYGPGWQEQGPLLELMINKSEWDKLPEEYRLAIQVASKETTLWMLNEFSAKNAEYLKKIETEGRNTVKRLPDEVLKSLRSLSEKVLTEMASKDPLAKKVYDSLSNYQQQFKELSNLTTL